MQLVQNSNLKFTHDSYNGCIIFYNLSLYDSQLEGRWVHSICFVHISALTFVKV